MVLRPLAAICSWSRLQLQRAAGEFPGLINLWIGGREIAAVPPMRRLFCLPCQLLLLCLLHETKATPQLGVNMNRVIICDAGSTGTRLYLFHMTKPTDGAAEKVSVQQGLKVKPGLSTFGDTPEAAVGGACRGSTLHSQLCRRNSDGHACMSAALPLLLCLPAQVEYLRPLFEQAAKMVPKHHRRSVPVYVLATAGMR